MIAGGLYIANAHKTSPGLAQILREALVARGLNGRRTRAIRLPASTSGELLSGTHRDDHATGRFGRRMASSLIRSEPPASAAGWLRRVIRELVVPARFW